MENIDTFQIQLDAIRAMFGDRVLLSMKDVGRFMGRDYRTAARHLGITKEGITQIELAGKLSRLGQKAAKRRIYY